MVVNERQLLETIKMYCDEIEERIPTYRRTLFQTLALILQQERQHETRAYDIQGAVQKQCRELAIFVSNKLKSK